MRFAPASSGTTLTSGCVWVVSWVAVSALVCSAGLAADETGAVDDSFSSLRGALQNQIGLCFAPLSLSPLSSLSPLWTTSGERRQHLFRLPMSQERLEWGADGRLLLTLKNVWKDGTHALTLEPHDLLIRLCAAIPPSWFNMVRHFGVFSSHSKHRSRAVPTPAEPEPGRFTPEPASGDQLELLLNTDGDTPPRSGRSRWGWLLRHVFRAEVETCQECGGPMRWAQAARDPPDIAELLTKHGLSLEPPPERPPCCWNSWLCPSGETSAFTEIGFSEPAGQSCVRGAGASGIW